MGGIFPKNILIFGRSLSLRRGKSTFKDRRSNLSCGSSGEIRQASIACTGLSVVCCKFHWVARFSSNTGDRASDRGSKEFLFKA